MGRSVVNHGSLRCRGCEQSPRWCICACLSPEHSGLNFSVLIHHSEFYKPTSTGKLIHRIDPSASLVMYKHDLTLDVQKLAPPSKKIYLLHPFGEPLHEGVDVEASQFVFLDGSWKQAAQLLKVVEGIGEKVSLPMEGPSFFWLRAKQEGARYSTMECAIFLLRYFGRHQMANSWLNVLKTHVYAGLLARGRKDLAEDYLKAAFDDLPEIISVLRTTK